MQVKDECPWSHPATVTGSGERMALWALRLPAEPLEATDLARLAGDVAETRRKHRAPEALLGMRLRSRRFFAGCLEGLLTHPFIVRRKCPVVGLPRGGRPLLSRTGAAISADLPVGFRDLTEPERHQNGSRTQGGRDVPLLPGRQAGGTPMEAIGIRVAAPHPGIAPNHEHRGFERVALIAGQ